MRTRDIVKNSIYISWDHKLLWIFAVLAGLTFSNSFRIPNSSSKNNIKKDLQNTEMMLEDANQEANVLGASTQRFIENPKDTMRQIFVTSGEAIAATSVTVTVGIMLAVFTAVVTRNWARGAFVSGVHKAVNKKKYTLGELSTNGRVMMVRNFKLGVTIILLLLGAALLSALLFTATAAIATKVNWMLTALVVISIIVGMGIVWFYLISTTVFSMIFLNVDQSRVKDALGNGYDFARANAHRLVKTYLLTAAVTLGLAVCMLAAFGLLVVLIGGLGYAIFGLVYKFSEVTAYMGALVAGIPTVFVLISIWALTKGLMSTFKYTVLIYLFNDVRNSK
ncbi:MAG: hypothetical protein R3B92_03020 [Patescibacteria group bacterium]|uniref:Uncharacterized protein n=1 Tax=candidate division WWE3 bacterium TaxID=2053526 RepID=A0A955EC64_UNCKA|nr:hypothetical protein [candidate division WWE3 bacterium]